MNGVSVLNVLRGSLYFGFASYTKLFLKKLGINTRKGDLIKLGQDQESSSLTRNKRLHWNQCQNYP